MAHSRLAPLHASLYHRCMSLPAPIYLLLKHTACTKENRTAEIFVQGDTPQPATKPSPLKAVASLIPN